MTKDVAVRLRLLGPMQAWTAHGVDILPSGRKARALLACIAFEMPRSVSRNWVRTLLWSRSHEYQARGSLRQEIYRLQDALSPVKSNILIVTRDHLGLQPGSVSTDVQEVKNAGYEGSEALDLPDANLLDGLEGIDPNFDAWLQAERNNLRNLALRTAEAMLQKATSPDEAIKAAEGVLTVDRTHEDAWRVLIDSHEARGEHGLAIKAYNRRCAFAQKGGAMLSTTTVPRPFGSLKVFHANRPAQLMSTLRLLGSFKSRWLLPARKRPRRPEVFRLA